MKISQARWLGLPVLFAAVMAASTPAVAQQQQKPNILFVMGDDIGWMQPSIYHEGPILPSSDPILPSSDPILGSSSFAADSKADDPPTAADLSKIEITLERSPCLGSCPVNKVAILASSFSSLKLDQSPSRRARRRWVALARWGCGMGPVDTDCPASRMFSAFLHAAALSKSGEGTCGEAIVN